MAKAGVRAHQSLVVNRYTVYELHLEEWRAVFSEQFSTSFFFFSRILVMRQGVPNVATSKPCNINLGQSITVRIQFSAYLINPLSPTSQSHQPPSASV
jgi:hypothetical protein